MFIETPATRKSLKMRKPVYGSGINDLDYVVFKTDHLGKGMHCPYYQRWKNMIERCSSKQYKAKNPTYHNVSCCDEWIRASSFIKWMKTQCWQGMDLDKDILIPNNKIYSPESCVFIPQELNKLLNFNKKRRGIYGIGIREFNKGKYRAVIRVDSISVSLGSYSNLKDANNAYLQAKKTLIKKYAIEYSHIHPNLEDRLNQISDNLKLSDLM